MFKFKKKTTIKVLISSFPRSGSTFTQNVMNDYLGYSYLIKNKKRWFQDFYIPAHGNTPNVLHESSLKKYINFSVVRREHIFPSEWDIEMIIKYNLKVILITRKLTEIILSLLDYLEGDRVSFLFIKPKDFSKFDYLKKIDFIIDKIIPWYIKFFVSWQRQKRIEVLWTNYDKMVLDKFFYFEEICRYLKISFNKNLFYETIKKFENDREKSQFNIGKKRILKINKQQSNRIQKLLGYYQDIDFSSIL